MMIAFIFNNNELLWEYNSLVCDSRHKIFTSWQVFANVYERTFKGLCAGIDLGLRNKWGRECNKKTPHCSILRSIVIFLVYILLKLFTSIGFCRQFTNHIQRFPYWELMWEPVPNKLPDMSRAGQGKRIHLASRPDFLQINFLIRYSRKVPVLCIVCVVFS